MASSHPSGSEEIQARPWTLSGTRSEIIDQAFNSFADKLNFMEGWSRQRLMTNKALSHALTQAFFAVLIAASIILVVIETNYTADDERDFPPWMTALNEVILVIFCFEVGLRVYVERRRFFECSWNVFDLLVVIVDAASAFLRLAFDLESAVPIVSFRIVRVMKIMRAVRMLSMFPELHTILQCLASAAKAVLWAALLLVVVLGFWGIFAVLFIHPLNMELTKNSYWERDSCERCPRAFESVQQSMLTFAQQIIAGDSWGNVTVPLIEHYPLTGVFFFGVLISVSLAVMNLVLAVIVDRASEVKNTSLKEEALKKDREFLDASEQLFQICRAMDTDGSGHLTFEELWHGFKRNPDFARIMATMDIGEGDLEVVFHILDLDGSHTIDYKEFADQLHMMKNSDSQTLLVFIKFYVMELRNSMQGLMKQGTQVSSSQIRCCSGPQAPGLRSDASVAGAAAAPPHPQAQREQTSGSSWCDTAGVVTMSLKETMNLLDMQQELSEVLRRHEEACKEHIKHLEAIVSPPLRADGSAEPHQPHAESPGQASGALGAARGEVPQKQPLLSADLHLTCQVGRLQQPRPERPHEGVLNDPTEMFRAPCDEDEVGGAR